jgi:L-alanine-DL-glutamate epimerase-like enolase superfamily enzyme
VYRIESVEAFIPKAKDALYKSWINELLIANPMSVYPEYKEGRDSWGKNSLSRYIARITDSDGRLGYGVGMGGEAACAVIEKHLKRFLVGSDPRDVERIWDQMFRSTAHYGGGALVMSAIAGLDLALWDLCGKIRGEPVYKLLGGATKPKVPVYGTGPQAETYKRLGFKGAKLPLSWGPADGEEGIKKTVALLAETREKVGPDFELMLDCYMSLNVPYAIELAKRIEPYHVRWIEDFLLPWEYKGFAEVRSAIRPMMTATGEHEYSRSGFCRLITDGAVDLLQPDLCWMGGVTEARKIAGMANLYNIPLIPHAQATYSYHFVMSQPNCPMAEYILPSKDGDKVEPFFGSFFTGEPLPENGYITLSDTPGWGMELRSDVELVRPIKG